jgi:HK97 family phage prohead protease
MTPVSEARFEGYASLFGVPDLARDVVERGAFTESLKRLGARGVRLLWQHDPAEPVGIWTDLVEDRRGLYGRGRLNLDVARGRELLALMREGAVDGLSIGYRTVRARTEPGTRIRRLLAVDLWEVSLVTFPLLSEARVSVVEGHPSGPGALASAIRSATSRMQTRSF